VLDWTAGTGPVCTYKRDVVDDGFGVLVLGRLKIQLVHENAHCHDDGEDREDAGAHSGGESLGPFCIDVEETAPDGLCKHHDEREESNESIKRVT
jgi:hypothetical protein